jgi:polo-like kinase 1
MSTSANQRKEDAPIPEMIVDPNTGTRYMRGKFLGKGGFARCYELTDMQSKEIFAGKIVSKQLLTKQHQKEKVWSFNSIHAVAGRDLCFIRFQLCTHTYR